MNYPYYGKYPETNHIVKFTAPRTGIVVEEGSSVWRRGHFEKYNWSEEEFVPVDYIPSDKVIIQNMVKFGGSFASKLGEAALLADSQNLAKIKETWSDYWEKYKSFSY